MACAISQFTPVTMAASSRQFENARASLSPEVRVVEMESNDAWMRDMGPSFVIDGKGGLRAVDWTFNAWGGLVDGLYFPWDADDKIARKVCEIEVVFGGGNIHCITQQVPRP